jgi:hypothetical protein
MVRKNMNKLTWSVALPVPIDIGRNLRSLLYLCAKPYPCRTLVSRPGTMVRLEERAHRGNWLITSGDYALTTDFSGSIRNVQISAPLSNMPAVTRKGAIQEPL